MGGHAAEEVGAFIDDRPHQHPAGAAPGGGDAAGGGVSLGDQVFGAIDEVVEGVALVQQLAGFVPVPAHFHAAPDVGDGKDETTVDQAKH